MVGRRFCHITPCHESLAINTPNKMCLPIKRTFNDFFALKKIKVGQSGCMLGHASTSLDWHVRLKMEDHKR